MFLSLKFRLRIYICVISWSDLDRASDVEVPLRQRLDTPFKLLMGLLSGHGLKGSCDNRRPAELQHRGFKTLRFMSGTGEDCCAVSVRNLKLKLPVPPQYPSRVSPCGQTPTYFIALVTVHPGALLMCFGGPGMEA